MWSAGKPSFLGGIKPNHNRFQIEKPLLWAPSSIVSHPMAQTASHTLPLEPAVFSESLSPKHRLLEAILFLSDEPISSRKIAQHASLADATEARKLIRHLNEFYDRLGRSFRVEEVSGGYQLFARAKFATWLRRLGHVPPGVRLSSPALETLSIVAYRQPVARSEIEAIRGVQCDELLKVLMERDLVRIAGRSEELGRPYLYETTRRFLAVFGLRSLEQLPRAELGGELIKSPVAEETLVGHDTKPNEQIEFVPKELGLRNRNDRTATNGIRAPRPSIDHDKESEVSHTFLSEISTDEEKLLRIKNAWADPRLAKSKDEDDEEDDEELEDEEEDDDFEDDEDWDDDDDEEDDGDDEDLDDDEEWEEVGDDEEEDFEDEEDDDEEWEEDDEDDEDWDDDDDDEEWEEEDEEDVPE